MATMQRDFIHHGPEPRAVPGKMVAHGGVAEWSIAPVLKTGNGQPFVSSNLTASATQSRRSAPVKAPLATFAFAVLIGAFSTVSMAQTQPPPGRTNYFHDPFGPATQGLAGCPVPSGPLWSQDEARQAEHYRVERGTSCYRSGQCRLPNSYLYDKEIFPRAVKFIQNDGRFDDTSIWLVVQRRWVFLQGCVRSEEQGRALDAAVRNIDDVEAVIGQWMVGTSGSPPYERQAH